MFSIRRGIGLVCIGLGVLALLAIMRGGAGRWGGRPDRGARLQVRQQPAAAAPQAPAANASPEYLRGYADGLEARQQNAQPLAPQSIRQVRGGGRDRHGGFGWAGLFALPFLILGGLLLFRQQGRRWGRGWSKHGHPLHRAHDRDHDRPLPSRPEAEKPPYTGETHRF
jgi:hypothetical protein